MFPIKSFMQKLIEYSPIEKGIAEHSNLRPSYIHYASHYTLESSCIISNYHCHKLSVILIPIENNGLKMIVTRDILFLKALRL